VQVTFKEFQGTSRTVEAESGSTLMETAIRNDIPGIDAECGGACACGTCHVYVDNEWVGKLVPPSELEREMLDYAANVQSNSRLSCQIKIELELDGLVVQTPVHQH